MPPIVVDIGKETNGATFRLNHNTEAMLDSQAPYWSPASDNLFLWSVKPWDFERLHGPMWAQIVMLLTGLSDEQIQELGGFTFIARPSGDIVFESRAA